MKPDVAFAIAIVVTVAVSACSARVHSSSQATPSASSAFASPASQQDPQTSWRADTAYVDSVYVPIAAIGDLTRYQMRRPGHDVDAKQFAAILRLAKSAQQAAGIGIPPGWQTIAAGFRDRTTDIVDYWPALKWLRASCTWSVDVNAPQGGGGTNGLHCPPNPPTVYMHQGKSQDPIDAADAYDEIIWGYSVSYAAAWNAANIKDPELGDPKHVEDVLTAADGELEGVVDWSDYRKRMAGPGL
jgi:hypothetical protein